MNAPGTYVLVNADEKIGNLILRAGGLTDEAFSSGTDFIRNGQVIKLDLSNILKNPRRKKY